MFNYLIYKFHIKKTPSPLYSRIWEEITVSDSRAVSNCQIMHIPHGRRFGSTKFIFMYIFIVCGEDCRLLRGCLYADWEELRTLEDPLRYCDKTICYQNILYNVSCNNMLNNFHFLHDFHGKKHFKWNRYVYHCMHYKVMIIIK